MDAVKAIVQKVIKEGNHGPFAVATSDQLDGSVTFSLEPTVWQGSDWPEEGMIVFLDDLRKKRAGWRAKKGRFWKPSDEQFQQGAKSNKIEFLYPVSKQFPFDLVCREIVLELEKRNWSVPGITVDFHEYGTGERKFRNVSHIKSDEFRLSFCRVQQRISDTHWNDIAAINEIMMPKKELHVYDDESGPSFYLYVGDDWERDRGSFMNDPKVNPKLNGKPRIYLRYTGSEDPDHGFRYERRRCTYLVHDSDLGREYDPIGEEPKYFFTDEIMGEFKQYLEETVLRRIIESPVPDEKTDIFAPDPPLPLPKSINQIFCFGDYYDADRIMKGRNKPALLDPSDRYGMPGSGYRLVPYDIRNDGTVPEIAYEGFLWCGIQAVSADTPIDSLEVPGHFRWSDNEQFVFRVMPKKANGIYIADHAAYDKRRKEIMDTMGDRNRYTNEEVGDFTRARGRTIIPISEYKGDYENPVVLVNRELTLDEVELVSGPHNSRHGC